jgi:type I restriction enzyme M protein
MALKKSELYSSLWASCDELRGGMDASQYKDYVLVLLFIKYVSDKYAGLPYATITVPKGASFRDMVALKGMTPKSPCWRRSSPKPATSSRA